MSEIAIRPSEADGRTFRRGTMLVVTAVGVVAFIAMLLLGAYAPDLRSGDNGGAHALSKAATGYSGLVQLAEATGRNPQIIRSPEMLEDEALAIITPENPQVDLSEILDWRGSRTTLIVLPKWRTQKDPKKPGWVRIAGLIPPFFPEHILTPALDYKVMRSKGRQAPLRIVHPALAAETALVSPKILQSLRFKDMEPVIVDRQNRVVLAKLSDQPLYVLADPDLLNNHGMADPQQAAAALALLDLLNSTDSYSILFDVTANGLGRSRSPLKLAFDPPFTAVTAIIFVAMLLAGWQALARFGDPRRPQRAIAFGKSALVENSAALVRKAGREAQLAPRYVATIRDRAATALGLSASHYGEELDRRLDSLPAQHRFTELAEAANSARNRDELLLAARRLNLWLKEVSA